MLSDLRSLDLRLAGHLGQSGDSVDIADSELFAKAATLSAQLSEKLEEQKQHQAQVDILQLQVTILFMLNLSVSQQQYNGQIYPVSCDERS